MENFDKRNEEMIEKLGKDQQVIDSTRDWFAKVSKHEYSYHFKWMGVPIIQFPQDIVAMQEIIWNIKPDLIIETGIARGGSIIYYASLLELIGKGEVIGVDIDIRSHNRKAIENHPMYKRITMIQGSSIDESIVGQVKKHTVGKEKILVILDSNHTHSHVRKELDLYAPFVSKGSYLVAFDTVVEDMPADFFPDRPWSVGDNPKTAVWDFLKTNDNFVIDKNIQNKLQITVAPDGYLKRIR